MAAGRVCLVAVDGSEYAELALNWFIKTIYRTGDRVKLVYCVDHHETFSYGSVAMIPGNPDSIAHVYADQEKKARGLLAKVQDQLKKHNISSESILVRGEPGKAIVDIAKEDKVNMIVTGSRGLGTIRRTVLGSVSDYIIHHCHCPVLVCRHE